MQLETTVLLFLINSSCLLQFFASKKKKTISPGGKGKKVNSDLKIRLDGSPSAKGSLNSFLVSSEHVKSPAKLSYSGHVVVSSEDPVRRNLTLEINLDSDVPHKPIDLSNDFQSQVSSENGEVLEGSKKEASSEGSEENIASYEQKNVVRGPLKEENISSVVPEEEVLETLPCKGTLELKQFAADFLSLYCSEVPADEQKSNGQKRNGSPSLLVADSKTSKKKHCSLDRDHSQTCSKKEGFEHVKSGLGNKPLEATSSHSIEIRETGSNQGKECNSASIEFHAGLRKCNQTPNSDRSKVDCSTPGLLIKFTSNHETPSLGQRNSIFSPGDAFWNEAIQVADELFAPVDKASVQASKSVKVVEGPYEQGSTCNVESVRAIEMAQSVLNDPEKLENLANDGSKLHEVVYHKASSFPIRHFDFSHDVGNLNENVDRQCVEANSKDISHIGNGLPNNSAGCKVVNIDQSKYEEELGHLLMLLDMDWKFSAFSGNREMFASVSSIENGNAGLQSQEDVLLRQTKNSSFNCDQVTTPSSRATNANLQLSSWLPPEICSVYMKRGISKLYPWQVIFTLVMIISFTFAVEGKSQQFGLAHCLLNASKLKENADMPEMGIADHLEGILEPLGKHVRSFYGNQGGATLPKDTSVAVCTIEKANSLVNRLLEEGRLSEVGIIVVDELHMVGDQSRGYLLELMLTKLRYAAGEGNAESSSGDSSGTSSGKGDPTHGLQIVGMSATMPNVAAVADWLQAALYETNFRPVPLEEYFKVGNTIYNKRMELVRTVPKKADLGGKDPDHIVELCNEVVQESHSVLIFCSSRKGCESTAKHVAKFLKEFSRSNHEGVCDFGDSSTAIEALRKCPAGLDPVLEETLPSGVAFHHAGLTVEEREIVEICYRRGLVRVLTATSTLAAGVNLPARRVIFRQPRIGRDFIDGTRYKQMAGRAGRTGIDSKGESILICKEEEVRRITAVLNDNCPPLQSCLAEDKNGMTHAILEVVAGGIVQTANDIHRYVRCTLLNSTRPFLDVVKSAQDSLRWLCRRKFVEWNEETKLYSTTPLGRASFGSSLSPEESLVVLDDLSRAREGFVLASDLHLVYLVTPINVDVEPDWELYYERFMELSALDQSVGNRIGVGEPFLMRMAHGAPVSIQDKSSRYRKGEHKKSPSLPVSTGNSILSDEQTIRVCKRFYVALMLARLVQGAPGFFTMFYEDQTLQGDLDEISKKDQHQPNEVSVVDVCESFKVSRGMVQALQENSGRFALMVSLFCERLGWHDLEGLVAKFQNRVSFGVRAEIVELTNIPYVKGSRARALYKAGLRSPLAIAEASISEIVKALFESSSWASQEGSAMRRIQLGVAKKIKNGARKIVLDQAEEARAAAFSAFKSLGVIVPQLSQPLLPNTIGKSIAKQHVDSMQEGGLHPSSESSSHFTNKEPRSDAPFNPKISEEEVSTKLQDLSQHDRTGKLNYEADSNMNIEEVNTTGTMQFDSKDYTNGTLGEGSAIPHFPDRHLDDEEHGVNRGRIVSHLTDGSNTGKGPVSTGHVPGGIDSFLDLLEAINEFFFDVQYTRKSKQNSPVQFEIHGIAICWEGSPVYYINLSKDLVSSDKINSIGNSNDSFGTAAEDSTQLSAPIYLWERAKYRWNRITRIMEQVNVRKVTWNLKIQLQVFKDPFIRVHRLGKLSTEDKEKIGIKERDDCCLMLPSFSIRSGVDMCVVAWILWPDEESSSIPNLDKEVKKRLSGEAAAAAMRDGRWRNQMRSAAHNGCCRRVAQTRALHSVLWKLLISENLTEVLSTIESPLLNPTYTASGGPYPNVTVLADMELQGIGVDMDACFHARQILGKKLKQLEKEAHKLAGLTFSLYATADIANVLYNHLKLPIPEGHNKGKQHPSTDKQCLDILREHRALAKLLNSTLGSICSLSKLCMTSQRYTVHGHWLQTSTATGRLSMEEPNLQCVEHTVDFTIQNDKNISSSSDAVHHQINARDFFIPTQDNWLLLAADYSQIELRLMAHFSQDSLLIELLSRPDGDVFTMMAARWTGQQESAINARVREQTKRLVYGILYGMGAKTLAEQLECTAEEAAEKIRSFKSSFPGVSAWLHDAVVSCHQNCYIETIKGRKRFLSKIKFGDKKERAKAQRQAVNSICQGSAADIIKIAMINIHSVVANGCEAHASSAAWAEKFSNLKGCCRILLQVHDELLLEVDPSFVKLAGLLLKTAMEDAVSLLVPLRVKLMVGRTWGSLEPFEVCVIINILDLTTLPNHPQRHACYQTKLKVVVKCGYSHFCSRYQMDAVDVTGRCWPRALRCDCLPDLQTDADEDLDHEQNKFE
ncbi:hypothetical protein ACLOJK_040292 [Asimina triloba]